MQEDIKVEFMEWVKLSIPIIIIIILFLILR